MPPPNDATDRDATDRDAGNQGERLRRLGQTMEAWLAYCASGRSDPEAFLAEHDDLREMLAPMLLDAATPAATTDAEATPTIAAPEPGPDRCLGDYRIRREIGRGGMGTVFEAEQISLGRTVALKVLHRHLAWSPGSIARFRREAAAAGRLRHPGIVPIHEVGESGGLHWFSMELVAGVPLASLVRADRFGVRDDVSRAAEAAELVARVGDALQHAHENGLVHRDVKPHNVMVCADGSVRLLDFGLVASAATDPAISASGTFLGTPHYCSPEQIAGGDVGPAGDVFALGIVLYELLAQVRPFEGATTQHVLSRIEVGEFAPLRRVAPATPRDLETICHKALERLPQDRYENAGALAADLRRFLRIEPIHALPPSTWTRSTKWVRRHQLRVALIATSALLVLGAPVAYAIVVDRERATLDQAEDLGYQSIEQTLEMLEEQLERQPGPGARHEPRVDEQLRLCESFLKLRTDEPRRQARLARAMWRIAGIQIHLGRPDAALAACARSRQLLANADEPPAVVHKHLGLLLQREMYAQQVADPSAGQAEFERVLAHWQPVLERTDVDQEVLADYLQTLLLRARNLADRIDRREDAEKLLREIVTRAGTDAAAMPLATRCLVARAEATLGQVLLAIGRAEPALEVLRAAVKSLDALPPTPALGVDIAITLVGIGKALQRLARPVEAETALRTAIATARTWFEDWPGSQQLRRALLSSRVLLGSQLLVQNKFDDADAVLREAVASLASIPPGSAAAATWMDRSLLADLDMQLANCILMRGDAKAADGDEAEKLLHQATDLLQALVAEHPNHIDFRLDLGVAWNSLAALANERGDFADGVAFAELAIAQQSQVIAKVPQHTRARTMLGVHQGQLAYGLAHSGKGEAAVQAAVVAIDCAPRQIGVLRMSAEAATLAAAGEPARADAHGKVAVRALTKLSEVNSKEALRLLADDRFAPLRGRDDFAALRAKVGSR